MITIHCVNIWTNKSFDKEFTEYWPARVFILRCLHGHSIAITGFETTSTECERELEVLVTNGW